MLMECPSNSLLNTVRAVLDSEQVNQVSYSFGNSISPVEKILNIHKISVCLFSTCNYISLYCDAYKFLITINISNISKTRPWLIYYYKFRCYFWLMIMSEHWTKLNIFNTLDTVFLSKERHKESTSLETSIQLCSQYQSWTLCMSIHSFDVNRKLKYENISSYNTRTSWTAYFGSHLNCLPSIKHAICALFRLVPTSGRISQTWWRPQTDINKTFGPS